MKKSLLLLTLSILMMSCSNHSVIDQFSGKVDADKKAQIDYDNRPLA